MTSNLANSMPFSKMMGVTVTSATPDKITGTLKVREDLCTTGGILHGGAIMAFADALGAIGAFLTLPDGSNGTTTIESKTNFLGPAPIDSVIEAVTKPVKTGSRLSIWQTDIRQASGKQIALVTQTQLVL
ncbi:PaaI family thioesterase [Parasphingorhabdus sp.]|uniref:PaaI family thioesterase n=1 Tax=Parasphingorhabdus sp. TaxID=2709688 RepID=UPI003262DA07